MPALTYAQGERRIAAKAVTDLPGGIFARTDLLRLCNSFTCPLSVDYGRGWAVFTRADVESILFTESEGQLNPVNVEDSFNPLTFHNTPLITGAPGVVQIPHVSIVRADEVFGCLQVPAEGLSKAEKVKFNSLVVAELVDERYYFRMTSTGTRNYNIRRGGEGSYFDSSLNDGEPWSWQEILEDLWKLLPRTSQKVPTEWTPPAEPPENLHFRDMDAWTAICTLLDYCHHVVYFDWDGGDKGPRWKIGAITPAEDSLHEPWLTSASGDAQFNSFLHYNARPLLNERAIYPQKVDLFYGREQKGRYSETPFYTQDFNTDKPSVAKTVQRFHYPFVGSELDEIDFGQIESAITDRLLAGGQRHYSVHAAFMDWVCGGFGGINSVTWQIDRSGAFTIARGGPLPQFAPPVFSENGIDLQFGDLDEVMAAGGAADATLDNDLSITVEDPGLMSEGLELSEGTRIAVYFLDGTWWLVAFNCDGIVE